MWTINRIFSGIFGVIAIVLGVTLFYDSGNNLTVPQFDLEQWWGPDEPPAHTQNTIKNYRIHFDEKIIEDLKYRIRNRRKITPTLKGAYSNYGINSEYLEEILTIWADKYDVNQQIVQWNSLPHFMTKIQGLDIHFIRVKPKVERKETKILPLLLLHGWPSSSREFHKIIPKLTTEDYNFDHVYEVVAPDLPGFGFSQGTTRTGLNPAHIAIIMRNLMQRLGYKTFYIQGGDWGSQVATHIATIFPNEVLGLHTNMPISSKRSSIRKLLMWYILPYTCREDAKHVDRIAPISKYLAYILRETGYFHIQATKPDTIGVSLTDSPAGLAAYILEKMAICANRDQLDTVHGGLDNLDIIDVLDTVTIAWLGQSITTSMRIYKEGVDRDYKISVLHEIPVTVPTAVINYKYEVVYQPNCVLRDKYQNIVHSTTLDFGGHFAGIQTPEHFVEDIFNATVQFLNFHSKINEE